MSSASSIPVHITHDLIQKLDRFQVSCDVKLDFWSCYVVDAILIRVTEEWFVKKDIISKIKHLE